MEAQQSSGETIAKKGKRCRPRSIEDGQRWSSFFRSVILSIFETIFSPPNSFRSKKFIPSLIKILLERGLYTCNCIFKKNEINK